MANRQRNPRRAKSLLPYSIAEAAELYGVHRQTVRNWLATGLQAIDDRRPILIHGSTLNRFHAARRAASKQTCGDGELFCLGCRTPRRPAGGMADLTLKTGGAGWITAICDRVMTQHVNRQRLAAFVATFDVKTRPESEPLRESR